MRVFLGAFGEPGHAFPMLALGAALVGRGHEVSFETWRRWREHVEAEVRVDAREHEAREARQREDLERQAHGASANARRRTLTSKPSERHLMKPLPARIRS